MPVSRVQKSWLVSIMQHTQRCSHVHAGSPRPSLSISSMSTSGLLVPTVFRACTTLPGMAPTYVRRWPYSGKGCCRRAVCQAQSLTMEHSSKPNVPRL